jgi:hypothetical protein
VGHDGGVPGFSTAVVFFPSEGIGLTVLVNADEKIEAVLAVIEHVVSNVLGKNMPSIRLARLVQLPSTLIVLMYSVSLF